MLELEFICNAGRQRLSSSIPPGTTVGGWDASSDYDYNTNHKIGKFFHLTSQSLPISNDVAKKYGISPGDSVYVDGHYLGTYDDRAPQNGTIDVYDPNNDAKNVNWGGMVYFPNVSSGQGCMEDTAHSNDWRPTGPEGPANNIISSTGEID